MARKKLDRVKKTYRIDAAAAVRLDSIVLNLGYTYAGLPAVGGLLEAIANGDVILTVVRPPKKNI